ISSLHEALLLNYCCEPQSAPAIAQELNPHVPVVISTPPPLPVARTPMPFTPPVHEMPVFLLSLTVTRWRILGPVGGTFLIRRPPQVVPESSPGPLFDTVVLSMVKFPPSRRMPPPPMPFIPRLFSTVQPFITN